jgi:hypothetical protein
MGMYNKTIPVIAVISTSYIDIVHSKQVMIDIQKFSKDIYYSDKYFDDEYEYRFVLLIF